MATSFRHGRGRRDRRDIFKGIAQELYQVKTEVCDAACYCLAPGLRGLLRSRSEHMFFHPNSKVAIIDEVSFGVFK
ncbi:MAG: hypothetical protein ACAI34_01760, partial [Verrucomicrobium sp.]